MAKQRRMPHEPLAGDRVAPAAEVSKRMASLRGQSRSDLLSDQERKSASSLGYKGKRKERERG